MSRTNRKSVLLLLLISVTLGGCAIKVAYHFLDVALLWKLDDYIDFNKDQRASAKSTINALHDWHRHNELPKYVVLLNDLADLLGGPVTQAELEVPYRAFVDDWGMMLEKSGRSAASILATLDDEQITALIQRMKDDETEELRKYGQNTPEEVREERYEFMAGPFKKMAGKLTHEQKVMIFRWASSLNDMEQMSLEHRIRWREHFAALLVNRNDLYEIEDDLGQLFSDPYRLWSEGYRDSMQHNEALTLQLITELLNSMTEPQRNKAVSRLRSTADDLASLSSNE